jgi:hypothetical protein
MGMIDIWYSSANFLHVVTVSTGARDPDSIHDLLPGTLPWRRPALSCWKIDRQANVVSDSGSGGWQALYLHLARP